MKRNALVLLLVLALVVSAVAGIWLAKPSPALPKTITVPDDYLTIQEAIDNASAGDTVFVKKGTYYCTVIEIYESISLVGEDANETIIHGQPQPHGGSGWNTIQIYASNVLVSNFTFIRCVEAITIYREFNLFNCSNIQIIGNKFLGNPYGISADGVRNLTISNNYFSNNKARGSTEVSINSNGSIISNNVFEGNLGCIGLAGQNVKVFGNQMTNNTFGIRLESVSNAVIFGNNITSNTGYDTDHKDYGYGVEFNANCNDSVVYGNYFVENTNGINLRNFLISSPETTGKPVFQGSNNTIHNNNFVDNSENANVEHEWATAYSTFLENYTNGTAVVSWDNGAVGNYWSDYQSKYPNATEVDTSGVGNTPYVIDGNNTDYCPLMHPVDISAEPPQSQVQETFPTAPVSVASIVSVTTVGIGLLVYFKKRKH
jgi:parallel beta-helix repeat protein